MSIIGGGGGYKVGIILDGWMDRGLLGWIGSMEGGYLIFLLLLA